MATPNWIGATTGQTPLAAQVNQFLGTHAITYLYQGINRGSQTTLGSGGVNSNSLYLAQSFTTVGAVTLGHVVLGFNAPTGTPTAPTTFSIQTSTGSAPTGTALVTTTVPAQYLDSSALPTTIPAPCSLAATTTYWMVLAAVGDVSNYVTWLKTTQVSGASTSPTGSVWTAQAYGLYYSLWDQSVVPPLAHTWEDGGARWTQVFVNGNNVPTSLTEYTVAQGSQQYAYSRRALSYTGASLISVV